VEIFPRLLTGPVRKNNQDEREPYLADVQMAPEFRRLAATSEDAFDAAVSALVMPTAVDELLALPDEPDYAVEGKIWQPRTSVAIANRDRNPPTSNEDLPAVVARILRVSAGRDDSAEAQAEQVLDELSRRGLIDRRGPTSGTADT